ncbi:MAG TPA: hypothetical protein VMW58_11045 [Anaerolineae bacterium]|nr:hypothetical protein [Anaerolineae bacterium]
MPTDPNVRRELLDQLDITRQGLSYRAKKIKEAYGPMTTEEAVYVIAHLEGIDLSKHLSIATLDRVRALVPRGIQYPHSKPSEGDARKPKPRVSRRRKPYPLVTASRAKIAEDLGSRVYPLLFIVENSIRQLISLRLSKKGSDWWDNFVPTKVKSSVERTMKKEARYPYRDKRGNHPLSFANFSDLKDIILSNRDEFQDAIIDFDWFAVRMDEIYMVRNNIAHCVPLSADDIARVGLFVRDWARLLETAGIK